MARILSQSENGKNALPKNRLRLLANLSLILNICSYLYTCPLILSDNSDG